MKIISEIFYFLFLHKKSLNCSTLAAVSVQMSQFQVLSNHPWLVSSLLDSLESQGTAHSLGPVNTSLCGKPDFANAAC